MQIKSFWARELRWPCFMKQQAQDCSKKVAIKYFTHACVSVYLQLNGLCRDHIQQQQNGVGMEFPANNSGPIINFWRNPRCYKDLQSKCLRRICKGHGHSLLSNKISIQWTKYCKSSITKIINWPSRYTQDKDNVIDNGLFRLTSKLV